VNGLAHCVRGPRPSRQVLATVLRERTRAAHVAPPAREEQQAQLGEHHADRVVGVVHEQRPAQRHARAPGGDVVTRGAIAVRAVDVEQVDRPVHVGVGLVRHAPHVPHAPVHPGPLQVGQEDLVVGLSALGLGGDLLRPAIAAGVRVDRDDLDPRGGRPAQDDRRPSAKGADLDDLGGRAEGPGGVPEPARLPLAQPALHVVDRAESGLEIRFVSDSRPPCFGAHRRAPDRARSC
jgi:hypothetical protein